MYHSEAPFPVYERSTWWSDAWNGQDYGREIDFRRPFFEQFAELFHVTPQFNLYQTGFSENSQYCNYVLDDRNCYLCYSITVSEDCLYGNMVDHSRTCADCLNIEACELLYQCIDCSHCYNCLFGTRLASCSDCWFSMDCIGCRSCFGCVNLHQGEYQWYNEQISKTEFERRLAAFKPLTREKLANEAKRFSDHALRYPRKFADLIRAENSRGDHIRDSRNCADCFDVFEGEDSAYVTRSYKFRDAYDCYGVAGHDLVYEVMSGRGTELLFAACSYDHQKSFYVHSCFNSKNLFGCVGLNHAENCILNREYSKADYEKLVVKLVAHMTETGEWGEFFPPALSPFGYNETVAFEYFPLTESDAKALGYHWSKIEVSKSEVPRELSANALPSSIAQVSDAIFGEAIICPETERPFRIVEPELAFYRRLGLPLPDAHPDLRHRRRLEMRTPRQLWSRECGKCRAAIWTAYAPERPEMVYCERCYHKEVFGE